MGKSLSNSPRWVLPNQNISAMYKRSTAFLYFTFRPERKYCAIFVQICLNKKKENCFFNGSTKILPLRNEQFTLYFHQTGKMLSVSTRNIKHASRLSRDANKQNSSNTILKINQ